MRGAGRGYAARPRRQLNLIADGGVVDGEAEAPSRDGAREAAGAPAEGDQRLGGAAGHAVELVDELIALGVGAAGDLAGEVLRVFWGGTVGHLLPTDRDD